MYEQHFGFHRQPFQCAELSRAFFVSEAIRSILPQLLHALRSDLGIAVLTGPPGVGKTSLLRHLQSLLSQEGRPVVCSGASLETPAQVLLILQSASQLRAGSLAPADPESSPTHLVRWNVVEHLRKSSEFWGPVLLLIDDAQLLTVQVLNELRAFSEEQSNGRSLVRCLISGPLSFEEDLARATHADFCRRIRCHAFLQPLTSIESIELLNRHLAAVGGRLRDVFSSTSLEIIAAAADGIPRCLSLLADEALVVASEQSLRLVDDRCVHAALTRLQHLPYSWNVSPLSDEEEETGPAGGLSRFDAPYDEKAIAINRPDVNLPLVDSGAHPAHANDSIPSTAIPTAVRASISAAQKAFSPGVVEFGGGAIEFGGTRTITTAPTAASTIEVSAVQAADPCVTATFSNEPEFEVGRRFLNEHCDSILPGVDEPYANADSAVDLDDSDWLLPTESRPAPRTSFADLGDQQSGINDDHRDDHGLNKCSGTDGTLQRRSVQVQPDDTAELMFAGVAGDGISNQVAVFDRYTWIAFGREVPSGTAAVTTSYDMQSGNGGWTNVLDDPFIATSCAAAMEFDHIAITESTDNEIRSLMLHPDSVLEHGRFEFFRTPAISPNLQRRETTEVTDEVRDHSIVAEGIASSGIEITFLSGDRCPGSGEHEEVDLCETDLQDNPRVDPLPRLWVDGHLLFGTKAVAEVPTFATESAEVTTSDELTLSREMVPSEQAAAMPTTEDRFFTLPVPFKAIDWDLRSALADFDEVLPLAESVAAFRDEVALFQQGGRQNTEVIFESPDERHRATATTSQVDASQVESCDANLPDDCLVSQARRRLEESKESQASCAVAQAEERTVENMMLSDSKHSTVRSLNESEMPIARHYANPARCSIVATQEFTRIAETSQIATRTLQFGKLFSRLRQMRNDAAETR